MNIDAIWEKIVSLEGERFFTATKLEFTYKVNNNSLTTTRTNYPLSKRNFEKALEYMPLSGPSVINAVVRGPAYVYAILMDKRVCG